MLSLLSSSALKALTLLLAFAPYLLEAVTVKCHQCGGAESFPKFAKDVFNKLNITSSDQYYGDCKATSGNDVCQNGTFCIKRAKVYQVSYSGVSLKWTTYSKGCATLREDNGLVPTTQCYDIGSNTNHTGYTTKRLDCYCQKDFCNSSPNLKFGAILVAAVLTAGFIFS